MTQQSLANQLLAAGYQPAPDRTLPPNLINIGWRNHLLTKEDMQALHLLRNDILDKSDPEPTAKDLRNAAALTKIINSVEDRTATRNGSAKKRHG